MIIIERVQRMEARTWEEAQGELRRLGIMLPDYGMMNVKAGRRFTAPLNPHNLDHYVTVRYEPDADR